LTPRSGQTQIERDFIPEASLLINETGEKTSIAVQMCRYRHRQLRVKLKFVSRAIKFAPAHILRISPLEAT